MSGTNQTSGNATLGDVLQSSHPIMSGINNFNGGSRSYRQTNISIASGGYIIAKWSDGLPLIAAKDAVGSSNVRRADLNFYPPSQDSRSGFWVTSSQGAEIMRNALLWVICSDTAISSITSTPNNNTNTGGVNTNLYIGYPNNSPSTTLSAVGSSNVTWSPSTNLSCSTCVSPVFTPTAAGSYTFTASNCKGSKTITICVKDIRVPNTSGTKAAVYMCHLEPGKTTPQTLAVVLRGIPGHFQYHKGDKLGVCGNTCTSNKRDFEVADLVIDEQYLEVMCTPNPFRNSFKLNYVSNSDLEATVSIYGMTGNLMETRTLNGVANEAELGNNLPNGIYTVSFNQGDTKKVFRMIKID